MDRSILLVQSTTVAPLLSSYRKRRLPPEIGYNRLGVAGRRTIHRASCHQDAHIAPPAPSHWACHERECVSRARCSRHRTQLGAVPAASCPRYTLPFMACPMGRGRGSDVCILMTTGSVDCSATRDAQPVVANFRRKSPFAVAREKRRYGC